MATGGTPRLSHPGAREGRRGGGRRVTEALRGHGHGPEGAVVGGAEPGRDLGCRAANMSIDGLHPPRFGVYAVVVDVLDGPHAGSYHGAASLGVRPMFGENRANLETYILDFAGDLYGAHLSVALIDFLRPEEKFEGVDHLIAQMEADCARARAVLEAL